MSGLPCSQCGSLTYNPSCRRCEMGRIACCDDEELTRFQEEERARLYRVSIPCRDHLPLDVTLVGCGKLKHASRRPAKDLYRGNLFRSAMRYAEETADDIQILSALHGVLNPFEEIEPYDLSMIQVGREGRRMWGHRVVGQLLQLYPLSYLRITILAGRHYADPLFSAAEKEGAPWDFELPLDGLTLGQRLKWFSANLPESASAC